MSGWFAVGRQAAQFADAVISPGDQSGSGKGCQSFQGNRHPGRDEDEQQKGRQKSIGTGEKQDGQGHFVASPVAASSGNPPIFNGVHS